MEEIWKVYKETYSKRWGHRVYEASNKGNVKLNGVIVEPYDKLGYLYISGYRIHRMVAELFIPNPENKPFVDHIDTNKHNNNDWNLRWVTSKENSNNPLTLQKMSKSNKRTFSEEWRQDQSERMKGKKNPMYGKQHPSTGKHRIYNDPNDHSAGFHY